MLSKQIPYYINRNVIIECVFVRLHNAFCMSRDSGFFCSTCIVMLALGPRENTQPPRTSWQEKGILTLFFVGGGTTLRGEQKRGEYLKNGFWSSTCKYLMETYCVKYVITNPIGTAYYLPYTCNKWC